jgi:N6-adenosine-specific RNA methylase IME4/ParB-like chromosome segregation protein Spo0J
MKIDEIKICERYRPDPGDIPSLAKSMAEDGLLHPIVVNSQGELIAGARRLKAALLLGWTDIPARLIDINTRLGERVENIVRKPHTVSERVAIGRKVEGEIGRRQGQRTDKRLPQELGEVEVEKGQETADAVAKHVGFGNAETYRLAKLIEAKGDAELLALVDDEECSIDLAAKIVKQGEDYQTLVIEKVKQGLSSVEAMRAVDLDLRLENIERISLGNKPMLTASLGRKFPVIYADPPWRYENSPAGHNNRSIEKHYPTMPLDEICAMGDDVRDLAADDAILYIWATVGLLRECLSVIEAWGFEYKTHFVWVKERTGQGCYSLNQHELLLVATRGKIPPPPSKSLVSSVIEAPRGAHSEKPHVVYEMIEAHYPTLAKIELFARNLRDGWTSWGNEIE